MGAYNEVVRNDPETCPNCLSRHARIIQFKYGDTWQDRYSVGDAIRWGGNDVGEPGLGLVTVEGYPAACPACGHVPDTTYAIEIVDNVIVTVLPVAG